MRSSFFPLLFSEYHPLRKHPTTPATRWLVNGKPNTMAQARLGAETGRDQRAWETPGRQENLKQRISALPHSRVTTIPPQCSGATLAHGASGAPSFTSLAHVLLNTCRIPQNCAKGARGAASSASGGVGSRLDWNYAPDSCRCLIKVRWGAAGATGAARLCHLVLSWYCLRRGFTVVLRLPLRPERQARVVSLSCC